jgi:type I restriction enzyme S subunit
MKTKQSNQIEWKEIEIGKLGSIITGGTPPKNDLLNYGDKTPWIKPPNLDNSMYVYESNEYLSEAGTQKSRLLPAGSVLVSCIGNIGKVAISGCNVCTNQQINSIAPNQDISPEFLYYDLKMHKRQIESKANKAVVPILNKTSFSKIKIPLPFLDGKPDLETQKQIVAILEKAERLKEKRKKVIEALDEYLKSTFNEMFLDKDFEKINFSEAGELSRGKSKHRPRNAPELLGGKYPLVQTGDIANSNIYLSDYNQTYSELGLKQSKLWPKGTLCITIAANIANTAILNLEACFPDSVVGFIPNKSFKTEYVLFWISSIKKEIENSATQVAQKNINLKILSDLKIPLPPLPLQQKFASIVEHVEKLKEKQKKSLEEIEKLNGVLMQKAFRGELI